MSDSISKSSGDAAFFSAAAECFFPTNSHVLSSGRVEVAVTLAEEAGMK